MDYLAKHRLTVEEGCVKIGDYIVIQRQDQTKLHKVSLEYVSLGKDKIDFSIIIGKPVWKTYKMIPKKFARREYYLIECPNTEHTTRELIKNVSSLYDDGIKTPMDKNIENSKSYQKKYMKKREKRYFDDKHNFQYVTVRWPTIRLISEIMFRNEPGKILGLRIDTLSQILTAAGVHSVGTYIVYENRCEGLVVAAVLNALTEGGHLIHVHPSNFAQNFAVNAMNFKTDQMSRIIYSNVNNLLMKLVPKSPEYDNDAKTSDNGVEKMPLQDSSKSTVAENVENAKEKEPQDSKESNISVQESEQNKKEDNSKKRKYTDDDEFAVKKAKWNLESDKAAKILVASKADGLIIVAREHPGNILNALLPYVAPSRPFVVFCPCLEPLLEMYVQLKGKNNTIGLRVNETFLRKHQINPDSTHPDASMSGGGGYLLTGIIVDSELVESVSE